MAACLIVAAGCGGPAGEASRPAELDEATTLSGLVAAQVRATDLASLARSLNPIVDTGGGCSSTRATIDTVEYANVAVAVAPTASDAFAGLAIELASTRAASSTSSPARCRDRWPALSPGGCDAARGEDRRLLAGPGMTELAGSSPRRSRIPT